MEYTGGTALRRKYLQKGNKVPKLKLTKDNSVLVFPFSLTMGFITSTENGIRQNDSVNVFDYSTFQRIFTGLENVLAQWDGAYKVEKVNDDDTFLTKTYSVGNSFKAYVPKENLGATFEASAISGDFLAEFTEETFTIHTYEDIQESDLFKLFIIPTLKENKWLYITGADKYFLPNGKLHHVEITLESLNNKIAKSGKAIEEFIQRSAPGEGYAFPIVDGHNVTLDTIRNRDVPTTSIQIEGAGAFAMGTLYAHGRPTIQSTDDQGQTIGTFNPKIESPRLLLPYRLETAIPSPVNTRPSAETDWLVGKFKPTLAEDFKDWKTELQSSYDLTMRAQYEGMLKSIDTDATVNATNPVNEGTRNNLLWDSNFSFNVEKIYKTDTDPYTEATLEIKKDITMPELLAHNIFGLSPYTALPLTVEQNVAWSLRDIPLVGGFLSKLTFGIPIGWTNTAIKVKMDDLLLAIPASLRDYGNVLIPNSNQLRIDLNTLTDEDAKNDAIELSGIKATGSIWKVQLTDRFFKTINGKEYIFNTNDLAQKGATGIGVPPEADIVVAGILYWDATCKPAPRDANTPGFVIDSSTYKVIGKMDIRTTFFSNNTQIWAGTHQTTSKFTGSIRDWTNATKYSDWKEDNNKQIDYPATITAPNPPGANNPKITINDFIKKYVLDYKNRDGKDTVDIDLDDFKYAKNAFWTNQPGSVQNWKNDDGKLTIKSSKTFNFDTSNYGGINIIRNNYKEIDLTIKYFNNQNIIVKINIDKLITTSKVIITEGTTIRKLIPFDNSSIGNADVLKEIDYDNLNATIHTYFEVTIDGNNIQMTMYSYAEMNGFNKQTRMQVPTNRDLWFLTNAGTADGEIINAILEPKTI